MNSIVYEKEMPVFLKPYCAAEEMQRLKKVDMNCGMNFTSVPLFQGIEPYTRYEHSVGVACIVHRFTKDPIQTLAGLFHDISTPAFSHVIDFMHGDAMKQESTEEETQNILAHSHAIMKQLKIDGILLDQVYDYHRYPIADNDRPKLSADRLEYTLSAAMDYGFASKEDLQPLYDDIVIGVNEEQERELVFQHAKQATAFTKIALRNGRVFTSIEDRYCMEILACLVKQAIDMHVLCEADLYTNEEIVTAKLANSEMRQAWQAYRSIQHVMTSPMKRDGWISMPAKKRYIDPYCLEKQSRVSQYDAAINQEMNAFLNETDEEYMKGIMKDGKEYNCCGEYESR